MSNTELTLKTKIETSGGAILLRDFRAHAGQAPVAVFHTWIGDRYCEQSLRVGDVAQAGEAMFEVVSIEPGIRASIHILERASSEGIAPLGESFELQLGQRLSLPDGQTLLLCAIGHDGIQLLFKASNGCTNYAWFDFGFWRDDGFLVEVTEINREQRWVKLTVSLEDAVNQVQDVEFGELVSLTPRNVVRYSDGTTVRLRRAIRQNWGAVSWRLLAENGDDISYPSAGSFATDGTPEDETDREFRLLGQVYEFESIGMDIEPLALRIRVQREALNSCQLAVPFHLEFREPTELPDGTILTYQGSGHGHGVSMGVDGEQIPTTVAWADFSVVQAGVTSGFRVDLMEFDAPVTEVVFGTRFTVSSVGDSGAVVKVDRADKT